MEKFRNKKNSSKFQVLGFKFQKEGAAVLPAVIIFGAVMLSMVIAGLLAARVLNRSIFGVRLAEEAGAAAQSVIFDVYLRLVRDDIPLPILCDDNNPVFSDYPVNMPGRISVSAGICRYTCGLDTCRYRLRVEAASALLVKRKMEAVFDKDAVSGQVKIGKTTALNF